MTPEEYRAEFDRVWPWLADAVMAHDAVPDKDAIWEAISSGRAEMWTTKNAAMTTMVCVDDYGVKEVRGWLLGGDLFEIKQMEPIVCEWAKSIGCQRATMLGRKAMLRVFDGYKERATLISKEL